jgi:hypothetical protein
MTHSSAVVEIDSELSSTSSEELEEETTLLEAQVAALKAKMASKTTDFIMI